MQNFHTKESLRERFGIDILAQEKPIEVAETQIENFEVHGYSVSHQPYNPMFDVQKQLPIYSKRLNGTDKNYLLLFLDPLRVFSTTAYACSSPQSHGQTLIS